MRTSDTLHCGFTGSGPGLEVVLSSRPSGRVCESASLSRCEQVASARLCKQEYKWKLEWPVKRAPYLDSDRGASCGRQS